MSSKKVERIIYKYKSDIMSLLGHDDVIIYPGKMMSWLLLASVGHVLI